MKSGLLQIPKFTNPQTLMIQGTTSDAGKSAIATGLCRLLTRHGLSVAPFKPQNMALNSAVTIDGGEIGRAQAVQAAACGIEAHTDMNPVLLKPNTDTGAQVIINGRAIGDMDARTYHAYKPQAMTAVLAAYERLKSQYDVVIVEGAGSPAEINLRDQDIANMGFAEAVDCPVIIAADIDRGGVFAHLLGTLELLSESERNRVVGMLINKFRGDPALLQPGNDWLEERTQKPLLAVLPYLHNLFLEAEDGLSQNWHSRNQNDLPGTVLKVAVPQLPRISNHTDFDALRANPQVDLHFVKAGQAWPQADLVILPGSKSVMSDLTWLRAQGWDVAIAKHLRYGGKVIGICGGLQMLGGEITDPDGIESHTGSCSGLGFMDFSTRLYPVKQLKQVNGRLSLPGNPEVKGYEIHAGISSGTALGQPLVQLAEAVDGVQSQDGQILGTYLHGLFDHPQACAALLRWAGLGLEDHDVTDFHALREQGINQLADMLEESIGYATLAKILRL